MKTTKRILALLVCLLMVLGIMPVSAVSAFAEEVPEGYTPVYTVEDLYAIRNAPDKNYILMNDIDLTEATAAGGDWDGGYGWSPIGEDASLAFSGIFDGSGYTISGMRIDNIQTAFAGLFGYVTGNITDLTLKDCVITSNVADGWCGTLAGYSSGNIENINIENIRMTSKCDYTGGLVAQYEGGHISDVKVNGSINATPSKSTNSYRAYCGGIAGYVKKTDAVIERCANASAVTFMCSGSYSDSSSCDTYGYCGGIAGYVDSSNTTISESYNTGVLTATASNRCSIYSNGILNSYSYSYCGGIIGYGSKAVNCYNTASVSGTASAQATNTYNSSYVRATTSTCTGGICGSGNAENCINLGEITATGDGKYGKEINKSAIASGTLKNNYYKVGTAEKGKSGTTDTATTAVSLTAAQMKLKAVFGLLDFDTVWFLDTSTGCNYPQLIETPEVKPVEKIELKSTPEKTTYYQHDEIDVSGGVVTVTYKMNFAPEDFPITADMLSGYDMKVLGEQTVTVTFHGTTDTFKINVLEIPVASVTPDKTSFSLDAGKTETITATVLPENATYKDITWTSDDESIATVDANGVVTAVAKGYAVITATAKSGASASCTVRVLVPATEITLNKTEASVNRGKKLQLIAGLVPSISTDTYSWKSGNEAVVTVDQNGLVTAIEKGTAVITVTSSRGVKNTCTVTVLVPSDKITLSENSLKLDSGDVVILSASFTPAESTDKITWSSSAPEVASVSNAGKVTAKSGGTATITATADSGKKAECTVFVLVPATAIYLDETEISLAKGENFTLTATVAPADSNDTYTWSTSDSSVVSVKDGKLAALKAGTATVSVTTSRGKKAVCSVKVIVHATKLKLNKAKADVDINKTLKLTATLSPDDCTDNVVWSSSDANIVAVASDGTVTAKAKGSATVTATADSGKKASCTVNVLVPAEKITVSPEFLLLEDGQTAELTAAMEPANTTDTIRWYSSDETIVMVASDGKLTVTGKGTATVTAETSRGLKAVCTVKVKYPAESVSFDSDTLDIDIGKSAKVEAHMLPIGANDEITWTSSDDSVVSVAPDGTVTALKKGAATLTATTESGKTATCTVTVLLPATGITLNKTSASMKTGESLTLTATLTPAGSTDSVTWKTSNAKVATVSGGTVKAVGAGSATITATTASGKSASCNVTVSQSVTGVTLNKTEHSVTKAGQYLQLTATVAPSNAANKAVTWSSDNTKVATVDNNGKVTIIGFGVANITVKTADGGKTATCKITALGIKLGDVDKDEKITAADARLALRKSVGLEKFSEGSDQFLRSDVDSDKKVTAADARLILRASVGLEKLPEGGGHYHIYNAAAKTVAPTCTAEGYTSNVCMICKQTIKSNTTKALGHSWKAATCTAPKTCTRCGAKEGSALGHNYSAATCTSAAKCTRCGSTSGSALGHSWKAATCTAAKTCTRCGAKEGSALGHSWKAATYTTPKTCTRCGITEGKPLQQHTHSFVNGKCSICGEYAFDVLAKWIKTNGKYDAKNNRYEYTEDYGSTDFQHTICYNASSDSIYINVIFSVSNSVTGTTISIYKNDMDSLGVIKKVSNSITEMEGSFYFDISTFTTDSPITMYQYNSSTYSKNSSTLLAGSYTRELLAFLINMLSKNNIGITLKDLGFKAYE